MLNIDQVFKDYSNKTNIIPNATTYEVPEGSKYLSDFLDDLPHDCFFNKVVTGCGGTTLALTNKENYVVTVHSLNVVKNKALQHSNVLGVHGEMSNDDIIKYLFEYSDKPKKFIVTYDSLPRLIDVIENNSKCEVSDFRLLVDEVQVLIRNLGEFKIEVSNNLLNNVYKFKSVCYLTATPTNLRYLPEPIKKLEYIDLEWPNLNKAVINHCRVLKQFDTKLTSFIVDKLDNTDDDIYVFYNSKAGVCKTINSLKTIYGDNISSNISIIFADNSSNEKYFKRILKSNFFNKVDFGYNLKVDSEGNPVDINRRRIKFISSFGFEGVDFYSFGRDVSTIIAADAKSKSMRYDISIDIPQILGRVRRDKTTGKFPKNNVYFIWKTMEDVVKFTTEEEVLYHIAKKRVLYYDLLNATNKNKDAISVDDEVYKSMVPYIILNNNERVENSFVMEAIMSTYSVVNIDYNVSYNTDDNKILEKSLYDISNSVGSFTIPQMNPIYNNAIDRKCSFESVAFAYKELNDKLSVELSRINKDNSLIEEMREDLDNIRGLHDTLDDVLNYISIEDVHKTGCHTIKSINRAENVKKINECRIEMHNMNLNGYYTLDFLMSLAADMIKKYDINSNPKMSFINIFYDTKKSLKNGVKGFTVGDKK